MHPMASPSIIQDNNAHDIMCLLPATKSTLCMPSYMTKGFYLLMTAKPELKTVHCLVRGVGKSSFINSIAGCEIAEKGT